MKSVLISIKPKWCELIASGKKTVEIRKSKPKRDVPFKCYIYCTKDKKTLFFPILTQKLLTKEPVEPYVVNRCGNGKVIGEFICDYILGHCEMANADIAEEMSCVKREDILKYSNGKEVYGWHISDLKIYDKPKALGEFCTVDNEAVQKCENRVQSYHQFTDTGYIKNGFYCEETTDWCNKCKVKPIKRPPQSWCYVESEVTEE